ncbi:MAG: heme biosynthesis HemY N-terminal domain-containing protein [Brevirhabdus sp.]
MLWSLIKILLFVGAIAAMTLGAGYLMETGGGITVAVGTIEFTLGPLQSIIAALVLLVAVWVVFKLVSLVVAFLRFINGDETALSRYFDRNRERKGFQALADGMMALASGEGRTAMSKAARAEKYLNRPELTNLLSAQAAEMAGDSRKAQEVYKRLLLDDRTRFVGVRGIMKQRLAEGDTDTAMKLAEKALALKPRHVETQDTLLGLQAEKAEWEGARKTLAAKLKSGSLPRDVHKRRDAVLALAQARDAEFAGETDEAHAGAIEANRLSPGLVPAAIMAAEAYIAQGKPRQAAKVIRKAWEIQPHPELAASFAAISPDETPDARIKRFGSLTRINANHIETRMLKAELFIAAEDFVAARKVMGDLAETEPTARSLTIMAAIERGTGADDSIVRDLLTRALTAPRGPQWVCDKCHTVHGRWVPVCTSCNSFDTLSWTEPPAAEMVMPNSVKMLPLIVGSIGDESMIVADLPGEPETSGVVNIVKPVHDVAESELEAEVQEQEAAATDALDDEANAKA